MSSRFFPDETDPVRLNKQLAFMTALCEANGFLAKQKARRFREEEARADRFRLAWLSARRRAWLAREQAQRGPGASSTRPWHHARPESLWDITGVHRGGAFTHCLAMAVPEDMSIGYGSAYAPAFVFLAPEHQGDTVVLPGDITDAAELRLVHTDGRPYRPRRANSHDRQN